MSERTARAGRIVGLTLAIVFALFVLACLGFVLPGDLAIGLLFGWIFFLVRVGPQLQVSWEGVATAALAAGLAWGLGHVLLQRAAGAVGRPVWRRANTTALLAAVVLGFVAGIAAVGIAHQLAWLVRSPEPWLHDSFEVRRRIQSINNLKQQALAFHSHYDKHGHAPQAGTFDEEGRGLHGWLTFLLPSLEQQQLYDGIQLDRPWSDPVNVETFRIAVPGYQFPRAPQKTPDGYATAHYALNARLVRPGQPIQLIGPPDGAANTILAGEVIENTPAWGYHANWRDPALGINRSPQGFGSPSHYGASFSFADGSVKFLNDDIDPQVLRALSTPDGGERLDDPDRPNDAHLRQ
ncbi:MAG: DUF1559 domain-containing protein [Pirellulales bacterium]